MVERDGKSLEGKYFDLLSYVLLLGLLFLPTKQRRIGIWLCPWPCAPCFVLFLFNVEDLGGGISSASIYSSSCSNSSGTFR